MTSTKTTTKNEYFKALVILAVLASLLAVLAARPAHADGEFIFKVNAIADFPDLNPSDGVCDVTFSTENTCTLRAAIQEANATPETDIIAFEIPEAFRDPVSGVATISPATELPAITQPTIINGFSQPGGSANTLAVGNNAAVKVQLDGSKVTGGAVPVSGLRLLNTSDSLIRGLAINRFSGEGIAISGDTSSGASIANNNRIEGNFIGTDPSGTQGPGNGASGVAIGAGAFNTVVGGTSPSARNLISGNGLRGVSISGRSAGNQVQGNYIGTDKSGKTDLGNAGSGVLTVLCSNNTIGGTTAGARNVISGNDLGGVTINGSENNKVLGNRIGTTASGTGPLGNTLSGVGVAFASGTSVGDGTSAGANTIAFNGTEGVFIDGSNSSTGNRVLSNSIYSNARLGINLVGGFEDASGNTANDPGDIDTGPNGLQNKPVLSSAKTVTGKTTVTGKLNSVPNQSYKLQFFSNPSGNEGKKLIGQKTVSTDTSGNASFTFSPATAVAVGQTMTATATRDSTLDTSEFSAPRKVASF
jgi:CSLREA domain-containing protein